MKTQMRLSGIAMLIALALTALGAGNSGYAQITHYDVQVDGLACPFCAYGLEKKFRHLPGADSVGIDLDQGVASLSLTDGMVTMPNEVWQAVGEAGFTPRKMKIKVSGVVRKDGDGLRLEVGDGHSLSLSGGDDWDRLVEMARNGHSSVEITGTASLENEDWHLRTDQVDMGQK